VTLFALAGRCDGRDETGQGGWSVAPAAPHEVGRVIVGRLTGLRAALLRQRAPDEPLRGPARRGQPGQRRAGRL
jgi:hypothetical protein